MKSATSFTVRIWIAGDYRDACRAVKDFCERGDCYSVAPCDYIYKGGAEAGVCVTRINYPRYPEHHDKILLRCGDLAEHLRRELFQDSYSIETPAETYWFSRRITSDGDTASITGDTEKAAIAAWNTRANLDMTDPADEITALRAQLAAAEADKLAAMERVRDAAAEALLHDVEADKDDNRIWDAEGEGRPYICEENAYRKIRAIDLDALAEGDQ